MDHSDLVAEMVHIEHMSTQERLHLARRRRLQQLKQWVQRERERNKQNKANKSNSNNKIKRHIYFSDNVMLLEAASRNDIMEVRRLLMKGVSPDSTNEDGLTALHQCCIDNNEEMMHLLVEFGANVNAEDSEKWTPLHAAATCGHLPLVKYLISRGANLLAVNADGNMPYDICEDEAALDHIESEMARRGVTQELIDDTRAATETQMLNDLMEQAKKGADLEWKDNLGATPLHIASANGYVRVVEYLLDQHVSTDVRDADGWQPVHAAACWGHLDVLEILVQNGADLNARTSRDETPADICEDPELRERIMTLKTEQESKKLQEAQRKRVKRTQSNNTRAQSVRRTSIRDKTLITKKDALEEARLRLQATASNTIGSSNNVLDLSSNLVKANNKYPPLSISTPRYEPDGMPSSLEMSTEQLNSPIILSTPPLQASPLRNPLEQHQQQQQQQSNTETSCYSTDGDKINIHVSVTINAGTLAELKKQRAQNRSGGSILTPSSCVNNNELSTGNEIVSPVVKRFAGNTEEDQVIGSTKSKHCCMLM